MSSGDAQISSLQTRLVIYRRTVAYLEEQRAQFGALAPTHIRHQLDETRQQIAQAKAELRELGAQVAAEAGDSASDLAAQAGDFLAGGRSALLPYQRMLADRLAYLSFEGLSDWHGPAPQLVDLYVERELAPLTPGAAPASLAALIADRHARILIAAEPGGGKSIALRRLALACVASATGNKRLAALFPRPIEPMLVPVLIEASDLLRTSSSAANGRATPSGFWEVIEQAFRRDGLGSVLPAIEHALRIGDCLVLIDGIDDIVDDERGRLLLTMLGRFVARYPDSRFVMTCRRVTALPPSALFGFTSYSLPPLGDEQIATLVARYYPVVAPLSALAFDDLDARVARLRGHLLANERLRALASNPLGAVLCVLTEAGGEPLPAHRGAVFSRMIDLLLGRWEQIRSEELVPALAQILEVEALQRKAARLALLQPLALAFQSRPDLSGDVPAVLRYAEIEPWLRESLAAIGVDGRRAVEQVIPRLLAWCERQGLLIANNAGSEYAMPWRGLREYLAARALANQADFPSRAHALAADPRWRETLLLAVRELGQGPSAHTARELLRLLLESAGDHERQAMAVLLAAECLIELDSTLGPARVLLATLQERLQSLLRAPNVVAAVRVRAGLLLGQLGDPRFAHALPPLVKVPAGPFLLGTREGYEDEGPQQSVDLPAFAIGTFPVTNGEYARFLTDAPDETPPKYWYDQRYNNPTQPVVGVTWHNAVAYCGWLTERLHTHGMLPHAMEARLPLETEWEKAASWDARRHAKLRYPWGDDWLNAAANTSEGRGAWVTAPVGSFPLGISPCGAHDMIGNVWEWTASVYASYPNALAPFEETGAYTLRGSSCASLPTHARCTYRSRLPPAYWRYHLGFRVVLARPLAMLEPY